MNYGQCGHCARRDHPGGKNACQRNVPHQMGRPANCGACQRQGRDPRQGRNAGVENLVGAMQQLQVAPRQPQFVEQSAVWVVSVPSGNQGGRVTFDENVNRFSELRRQYALVTMSNATAEPVVDGTSTTGGSVVLSFATDRETARARADIMGREVFSRVTGTSAAVPLVANLGGVHASRHVATTSRGGAPGLVLDYDSTLTIAFSIRIVVRVRCVGPLSGGSIGPTVPAFNNPTGWATNVTGLLRVTMGQNSAGTHLRVQGGRWQCHRNNAWTDLLADDAVVDSVRLPVSSPAFAAAVQLPAGVYFFM